MNRLELEQAIKDEGAKRNITIVKCSIHDRETHLDFYPEMKNERAEGWICEHQVEELIHDIAPIERPHKIQEIRIASRTFNVGDTVEVDNLWIKLAFKEKEPKDLIRVSAGCGQYRQGWVRGTVIETPEQNDRALVVTFPRDIWCEKEHKWWGTVDELERGMKDGRIDKIEAGEPLYSGTGHKGIRLT